MSDRSNRREVRNPVLSLPAVKRLNELSPEARAIVAEILGDLVNDARARAQQSWVKNKGPMAAYWKAVGAYAHHFRRVVKNLSETKCAICGGRHDNDALTDICTSCEARINEEGSP